MTEWLTTDLKRLARQLDRHVRRWPRAVGGTLGAYALGLVVAVWSSSWTLLGGLFGAALFAWVISIWSRHMLRARWRVAARGAGLEPAPRITSWLGGVVRTPYGSFAMLTLRQGQSIAQLDRVREILAANLDVMRVEIERDEQRAGHVRLDVVERLPWTPGEILPWPLVNAPAVSLWDAIPVGLDMHLAELSWQLCVEDVGGQTALVGGVQGSGKSRLFDLLVAAGVLDPDCTVILLDGKEADMWPWRDAALHYAGFDMDEAVGALGWVDTWVNQRLRAMATERWVDAHGVEHVGKRWARRGDPTVLLVCDEVGTYVNSLDDGSAKQFLHLLHRSVQRGRAAGLVAGLSAQKASGRSGAEGTLPTGIRDLLTLRAGFRANTPEASDMVNGKGLANRGYSSVDIPIEQRGVAWVTVVERAMPALAKTYALTEPQRREIAARGLVHQPRTTTVPGSSVEVIDVAPVGVGANGHRNGSTNGHRNGNINGNGPAPRTSPLG